MPENKNEINITPQPVGLVDADLLCKGTRHPNLVLLKLAGYFRDNSIPYKLIYGEEVNLDDYQRVYLSRVFTFTTIPSFITEFENAHPDAKEKIQKGGTGFYATIEDKDKFDAARREDMNKLQNDPFLPGFSVEHQMPDYDLYTPFIQDEIANGVIDKIESYKKKHKGSTPTDKELKEIEKKVRSKFKDYLDYSIGFLTRGCVRQCDFCVNKGVRTILPYSQLNDFVDQSRPYIYLWDDNFLCYRNWKELLEELNNTGKPFQFRQGLDERVIDSARAKALAESHYHGDFIFAFDQWKDRELIIKKLDIWRKYCPEKTTKFYLFCGFQLTPENDDKLFYDIYFLFRRIEILMSYGCLGYVMRHADYENHRLGNMYVQIARWCNQPQFYKKMSFLEFIERNQTYKEETAKAKARVKLCKTVVTYQEFCRTFADKLNLIQPLFNMKFEEINNPSQREAIKNKVNE